MDKIKRINRGNRPKGGRIGSITAEKVLADKKKREQRQEEIRNERNKI